MCAPSLKRAPDQTVTGAVTSILYKSTKAIPLPLFLRVRASANMSIF